MPKTFRGLKRNYIVRYLGVAPHPRTGQFMITLLYQFKKRNIKVTQVSLDEFRASEALKKEIKRTYGEKGDDKLREILNDPDLNGPEAAHGNDGSHYSFYISEPRLQSSSLLFGPEDQGPSRELQSPSLKKIFQAKGRESKAKARDLIPPGLKGTYKKFKPIPAALEAYMTRHGRRDRRLRERETTVLPLQLIHGEMGDGDSSITADFGETGELIRMIEEGNEADRDDAARQRQATTSGSDSEDGGMLPAMGLGVSGEQGIQEAIDAIWSAGNSETVAYDSGRASGPLSHPFEGESEVHDPTSERHGVTYADNNTADSGGRVLERLPQEMQAPQQISLRGSLFGTGGLQRNLIQHPLRQHPVTINQQAGDTRE